MYVCGAAVRRKSVYVRFLPVRESVLSPCSVRWKVVGIWAGWHSQRRKRRPAFSTSDETAYLSSYLPNRATIRDHVWRRRAMAARPMISNMPDDGSGTLMRSSSEKATALGCPCVIVPVRRIGVRGV